MPAALQVSGLSKRYRLGAPPTGSGFGRFFRRAGTGTEIWALEDVSFEVAEGAVLGIVGRNGAGKSTLLKVLSRITEPSAGRAEIRGRVGSLLEVGTGFHPELTGRENVFLNGAILGMGRHEIGRKFDAIVSFAGIEPFVDTPVKRYSSGMYVRLAFAVAAHLEPDILIVDEVLAVGDAAFQKRCLGKMGAVAREGRTVLFVSHNMTAVRNLCREALWLEGGRVRARGEAASITDSYLKDSLRVDGLADIGAALASLPPDPAVRLEGIAVRQRGIPAGVVMSGEPVEVEVRYRVLERTTGMRVYLDLCDEDRNVLVRTFHDEDAPAIPTMEAGRYVSTATFPPHLLAPREYEVRVRAGIYNLRTCTGDGVGFPLVVESSGQVNRGYPYDTPRAKLQPLVPWRTECRGRETS